MTLLLIDFETNPEKPIKKTIGIIIRKDDIKLRFRTFSFLAAYTLCQFP